MSTAEALADSFARILAVGDDIAACRGELRRAADALASQAEAHAVEAALADGLHPDHGYTYAQAGRFLGVKAKTVANTSVELLPRVRPGVVLGIDVMAFRGDVSYEAAAAYKARKVAAITRP